MPQFKYKAKDKKGELVNGVMDAESRVAVVNRLQAMGLFPLFVADEASDKKSQWGFQFKRKPKLSEITSLIRQLADMISAGIPIVKTLTIVTEQLPNEQLREVLIEVSNDVQGGATFANALAKHNKIFSKLFISMVRAGETGGMLDDVLRRLADYSEAEQELKGKIRSALAYPCVMVIAGIGAIIVLMTVVIPKIVKIFVELNQTLPTPTLILIKISDFLGSYWWLILIGLVFGIAAFIRFAKSVEGKKLLHSLQLRVPFLGQIILKREIARFSRTFGSLLKNGVSILPALEITREVLTNVIIAEEVAKLPEHITQGEGIAAPLRNNPFFPPIVVNMMTVGEETGKLDEILLKVAVSYESEVERGIKTFTSLLEPMVILLMGVVVGFIVISILLPIFSIDPSAGK